MSQTNESTRSAKSWKVSSHHGAGEWLAERFTSLILIPLTLWCAWAACQVAGGGYDAAVAFLKAPLNAGVLAITILISAWHMYMGVKVIIDDYIGKPGTRGALLFLLALLSLGVCIASLYGLYLIHQAA